MTYNVHIYTIVRAKVLDVEANSQEEAIKPIPQHVQTPDEPVIAITV